MTHPVVRPAVPSGPSGPSSLRDRVADSVVGRDREVTLLLAALASGRDVLLEGPPGTSKSTLLRAISAEWHVPFVLVEGNAELTPARFVGHHDPARVLTEGYGDATFVAGPLVEAMRAGGLLYLEELNRAPEDTLNVLLGAMAERAVVVPRAGTVTAAPGFRLVASMNPFDDVGTARISDSVHDRWCRLAVGYQDAAEEEAIVTRRTGCDDGDGGTLVADGVALTRATRGHPELRRGSSVRGAIDLVAVAAELRRTDPDREHADVVLDAALLALSGRIAVDDASPATPEQILRELWEAHFSSAPGARDRVRTGPPTSATTRV